MSETGRETPATQGMGPQAQAAFDRLFEIISDNLRHGFFRVTVSCEIGKGNRREMRIEAGKSDKFIIPEDELPR